MILIAYCHGLRVAELVDLRWDQIDFNQAVLHVRRVKKGTPSAHPLTGRALRALRRLKREGAIESPFVFVSAYGFTLANAGHDTRALQAYLGHRNIQHTVRYTELTPPRFKGFWRV